MERSGCFAGLTVPLMEERKRSPRRSPALSMSEAKGRKHRARRSCHDGASAARELIKYMLKDITATGSKVPPAVFAQVFEAPAQRRMRNASKGFMGLAKHA